MVQILALSKKYKKVYEFYSFINKKKKIKNTIPTVIPISLFLLPISLSLSLSLSLSMMMMMSLCVKQQGQALTSYDKPKKKSGYFYGNCIEDQS